MAGASPSSSPRLPSPPPIAEDQIGPMSPIATMSEEQAKLGGTSNVDTGASRRIRPGTKAADIAEGPPLVDLTEIDSAFQLTEHLKALHNSLTHPSDSDHIVPIDRASALRLAQPPEGVDRALWLYELCRFLCQKINSIITALFADTPPCSAQTCVEMRASEWQYLCAVHDPPKSCCAIDYCCHTLDWATNILTSPKHFPSRLALGTETGSANQQVRQLTNIFRRVYRIFAHAWFSHRDMFWKVESKTGLYVLYKTVCDYYKLIQEENYTISQEAEGIEEAPLTAQYDPPKILKKEMQEDLPVVGSVQITSGLTTKRHRQSPSAGPNVPIIEENEEEEKGSEEAKENSEPILEIEEEGEKLENQAAPGPVEVEDEQSIEETKPTVETKANGEDALQEDQATTEDATSDTSDDKGPEEPQSSEEPIISENSVVTESGEPALSEETMGQDTAAVDEDEASKTVAD